MSPKISSEWNVVAPLAGDFAMQILALPHVFGHYALARTGSLGFVSAVVDKNVTMLRRGNSTSAVHQGAHCI